MSMEMRVFFAGDLPKPGDVEAELRALGLGFSMRDVETPIDGYGGFVPMLVGEGDDAEETGVEVHVGAAQESIAELGIEGVDPSLDREVAFRWGGDLMECACANALAVAIARVKGGTIWDDSAGASISVEGAVANIHACIALLRKTGA